METANGPNKSKIAKRVIEVFEFLDQHGPEATVTNIVRRYNRPQSSTSELLSCLVEMGLLYKDPRSRIYSSTPRLAALGTFNQPACIREGHLFAFMDRLARTTGKNVVLFGMVGMHVQIFRLSPGKDDATHNMHCGASEKLSASAAGLLLLSTLSVERAGGILRRLNAEAPEGSKFNYTKIGQKISLYRKQNHAIGNAGFASKMRVAATLLPQSEAGRPLALGILFPPQSVIDAKAIIMKLDTGVAVPKAQNEVGDRAPGVPFRMAG